MTALLLGKEDTLNLTAQIPQMVVVHQAAEVKHIRVIPLAVQTIQKGDKPASQAGEHDIADMDKTTNKS